MRNLLSLEQVIALCNQKLPSHGGDYQHHVTAIRTLFGLFVKAQQSSNPKAFLLQHLESACTHSDVFEPNLSKPLCFTVDSPATFHLGVIYFEFLSIFDETVCQDAQKYIDILSDAPIWKTRLLNASKKMLQQFSEYYRNLPMNDRQELHNLGILDFDNIQIKNALSLYRFRADEMGRQYAHLAHVRDRWKFKTKVHFDFRVMPDLPSQAFEHPTLLCLKKPDSTSFFYYPARVLEHYPVSIDQLKHAQWGDNYVIDYRVNRYQLAPGASVEIFVNKNMPSLPAIIQHGEEEHWVYGKTLEGLRLNRIEAQMAQQDDFELSMWIYEKAFHIPLIRYQKDYPIFNKIKQILDSRTTLKAPDYPYIHLIEDGDNLQMEAGHLYVKKNDYDHRLTVSLIACSGQSIDNLETNIELHADHLSETDSAAIKNFLKTERLIPFLERTQLNLLDHLTHLGHRDQEFISNEISAKNQQINHDYLKTYLAYTTQSLIHGVGLWMLNQRFYAGFNFMHLINLIQKIRAGYPFFDEEIVLGSALVHKQQWGYWLKVCLTMMLFSGLMTYFNANQVCDAMFVYFNRYEIYTQAYQIYIEYQATSTVSLDNQLSLGFVLFSLGNYNIKTLEAFLLIQLAIVYYRSQNIEQEKDKTVTHQNQLMQQQTNLQNHLEHYNTRVQQAAYCLQQMQDLLEDTLQHPSLQDPMVDRCIDTMSQLMNQYFSFMSWRDKNYIQHFIQYNQHNCSEDFMALIEVEKQRFHLEALEMDTQFEQIQEAFQSKGEAIQSQFAVGPTSVEDKRWSWIWLYQPSTMISSGLLLATASIAALHIVEFGVILSLGMLASQLLMVALMAATVLGVSATIYGLLKHFEHEELSDFQLSQAEIAPSPNNS